MRNEGQWLVLMTVKHHKKT